MKKQYYYHITEQNWDKEILLYPKENGDNRDEEETKTPRICVAKTIEGCLIAIYLQDLNTINIYRTKEKVLAQSPIGVCDSKITGEMWITKPTKFVFINNLDNKINRKIHYIDRCNVGLLGDGEEGSKKWQRKYKKIFKKLVENHLIA